MPQKPLDLSSGFKTCPQCETSKPLLNFYRSKSTLHGYAVYCKACSYERHKKYFKTPEQKARAAERARGWRKENPRRYKDWYLQRDYGLAPGGYDTLLKLQKGCCAICQSDDPGRRGDFHVDHCHATGRIRGLLCHGCNVSLGHFHHDSAILQAAIRYLTQTLR